MIRPFEIREQQQYAPEILLCYRFSSIDLAQPSFAFSFHFYQVFACTAQVEDGKYCNGCFLSGGYNFEIILKKRGINPFLSDSP